MSAIELGKNDLEYNAQYRVLICRQCQYAIQKSAIESHLLRHKIYRGNRQILLSSIARLDLLEPEQVPLPPSTTPAIDGLPVISGHRCTTPGCEKLCSSLKRMRAHWTEEHGLGESNSGSLTLSRPAKLQTFFKGTKIKYFEVESRIAVDSAEASRRLSGLVHAVGEVSDEVSHMVASDQRNNHSKMDDITRPTERDEGVTDMACPGTFSTPGISGPQYDKTHIDLNLEAMAYFHQFITTTSMTLPLTEQQQYNNHKWQLQAVNLALEDQGLMSGLMAIAAMHKASLVTSLAGKSVHVRRAEQFRDRFSRSEAWQQTEIMHTEAVEPQDDVAMWASQIRGVIRCVDLVQTREPGGAERTAPMALQSVLQVIQDLVQPAVTMTDPAAEDAMMAFQTSMLLEFRDAGEAGLVETMQNNVFHSTLLFLNELGPRIAEAVSKPNDVRDVFATLAAIDTLRECCIMSFEANDVQTAWRGMSDWWTGVPDRFRVTVLKFDPAPLLVLACWAAVLVRRAEAYGCWFIDGMASILCTAIETALSKGQKEAHELFERIQAFADRSIALQGE